MLSMSTQPQMSNQFNAPAHLATLAARRLSRRALLLGLSFSITGAALAACAPKTVRPEPLATMPSPQLPQAPVSSAAVDGDALVTFLALSVLLTGVQELDPTVGAIYLAHLQATQATELAAFSEQAGFLAQTPPATLEAVEETGLFAQEPMRQLADRIIELWYTGQSQDAQGEAVVVTFVDALAWKVLDFTKPPTICGAPGFWAFHPSTAIISS